MNNLFQAVSDNLKFVAVFIVTIAACFFLAWLFEKLAQKRNRIKEKILTTRKIAVIGVFSAISAVLMLFEFPLPFAPSFYKLDFSELPALIGGFAFGPVTGVMIEFIKVLLHLAIKGTSTAFVGEYANFVVGVSFILTSTVVYDFVKNRVGALISCIAGTLMLTFVGTAFNAIYLLPTFAKLYGMPMDALIGMGTAINPKITNVTSFVILAVAPLNLIKGGVDSLITFLVYKQLSPILKYNKATRKEVLERKSKEIAAN